MLWLCLDLLYCRKGVSLTLAVALVSQAHFYIPKSPQILLVREFRSAFLLGCSLKER